MNLSEFSERYPGLFRCLNAISYDNDMPLLEDGIARDRPSEVELAELEALAIWLDEEETELMAAGEESARESFVRAHDLHQLDSFLAKAFDGELQDQFFRV